MTPDDQTPVPGLIHAFDLSVERGTAIEIGKLASGGRRAHVPITGGIVEGSELSAVLVGGSEAVLERGDGVAVVEVNYLIRAADGATARAFGHGYRTDAGDFAGTRLSLLFEADEDGSLAHLVRAAFLAEALPGNARLTVMRID
ncbi:MAG TPA: DUF3237 family protein [Sphingomonadaceae bacterium]